MNSNNQFNMNSDISISICPSLELIDMSINYEVNSHSILNISGRLKNKTDFDNIKLDDYIIVKQRETILFNGIVVDSYIKIENNINYITLHALSSSYILDITKKYKSFQDKNSSYQSILQSIASQYKSSIIIDNFSNNSITNQYLLQYDETDWDFIKRLSSHFNSILIPHNSDSDTEIHAGIPKLATIASIYNDNFELIRDYNRFNYEKNNGNDEILISGVEYIKFIYSKYLPLGYPVLFNDNLYYIYKSESLYKNSILSFSYTICDKSGMTTPKKYNKNINGISIKGKIIDRINDKVKVHMEIDESQNLNSAWLFPYSTHYSAEGNSGWYCMPENGDTVNIYHPNDIESNSFAISGQRYSDKPQKKLSNPDIKYFRTPAGKELKFSDDEVLITANDNKTYLRLNERKGIKMRSNQPIEISTVSDLNITSGEAILIDAYSKLELECKSSKIKMTPAEIEIKSGKIKHN